MAGNALTIAVSVSGTGAAASGLGNVAKGLIGVGSALMLLRKGLKAIDEAVDKFTAWESAMEDANRMMGLESGELEVLKARLLAATGPLQDVVNLHEQLPDAMYRMASAGEDEAHMLEDLNDIAMYSAAAHMDLGSAADKTMGIMRAFTFENGEADRVIKILIGTEQIAIATADQVSEALRELAPAFNVAGEEAEVTAAALATMTRAGYSAKESATALRRGWGQMHTEENRAKLAALGVEVTNFTDTMQQIKERGLTMEDWIDLLGIRQYATFSGMIEQWDTFGTALEAIKTADPAAMFDAFGATAEAAGNRIENEFNRRLIEIGERLEPARRELTIFAKDLELMGTELAAFILKNKEAATAVAAAIFIISQAITGTLTKTPLGRLLMILEGLILVSSALSAAFGQNTRAALDMTNALQESVDRGIAQIQTAEDQVEAEMEAAKARKDGAERVKELAGELENLREKEADLIGLQSSLARSATELEAALAAEEMATTLTGNAMERLFVKGAAGAQKSLADALKSWKAGLTTVEQINEATDDLVSLNIALADAVGDEAKTREVIAGYLSDTLGLSEGTVRAMLSGVDAQELAVALAKGMNIQLDSARGKLQANEAILLDSLKADYTRLGILKAVNAAMDGTLQLSKEELEVLIGQVGAETAKLRAIEGQAEVGRLQAEAASLQATAGSLEEARLLRAADLMGKIAATARAQREEAWRHLEKLKGYRDRGAEDVYEEYEGTPEAQGAEDARGYWRGYEGVTREELARAREERIRAEEETQDRLTDVAKEAQRRRNEEILAAIEEDQDRAKSALVDLAGVFRGVFTNESWNFWDSFENMGLQALDDLLQYAILSGLFSLFGLGPAGKPGGLAGGILDLLGFAEGGFVTKPTLAVAGEQGPEWIIPRADMLGAMAGGMGAVESLLSRLSGQTVRGPAPSGAQAAALGGTTTYHQHFHYAPAIGSLDKMDEYGRRADAGYARRSL